MLDDANIEVYIPLEGNVETADDVHKEEKKSKKHGLLNWLKPRVCCSGSLTTSSHTIIIDTSRYLKISVILTGKTFLGMKIFFLLWIIIINLKYHNKGAAYYFT